MSHIALLYIDHPYVEVLSYFVPKWDGMPRLTGESTEFVVVIVCNPEL